MELLTHELPCGLKIRYRSISDPYIIGESGKKVPFFLKHGDIFPEDTFYDIGAQIGIISLWASTMTRQVLSFECEPENYALLDWNTANIRNVFPHRVFVCGNSREGDSIEFYRAKKNLSSHSAYIKRGREEIIVPTHPIGKILDKVRPHVVKLDVEGAEYEILLDGLLDDCKDIEVITFEAHFGRPEWHDKYQEVLTRLQALGYRVIAPEGSKGWPVFVHATRRL